MALLIFDLDGTLLDTVADLASATNHALSLCGYPTHPTERYKSFVGNGINKLFERALPESERGEENIARIRQHFLPYYNAHNTDLSVPYPGIPELLAVLQSRSVRLAVASNKYHEATSRLIAHFFPQITFVSVQGNKEGVPRKPDPTIVQNILAEASSGNEETANKASSLGRTTDETILFIGDSGVDMQTAHNAGLRAVGVSWGFRPRAELEANGADWIIDSPEQLLSLDLF